MLIYLCITSAKDYSIKLLIMPPTFYKVSKISPEFGAVGFYLLH